MKLIKIVTVIGARPQFIKAAAVSRELLKHNGVKELILHTGQHWHGNMSEIFFKEMCIPKPNCNLNVNSLRHGAMTGRMIEGIEKILIKEKPDYVLVYGDTNSTLAGALAAKKLEIKLVHIEAGLRSFNMKMPEEINRIITDRISDILFCPTNNAVENLNKEGFGTFGCRIIKNGDVMQDAALYYSQISDEKSSIIKDLKLDHQNFILCTIHRQENTDNVNNLQSIIAGLNKINEEIKIVLPLHPRTRKILKSNAVKVNMIMIEPVGYLDIIALLKNCTLVITDSGGLQKEAFFFKKHCITLREQTEWTELVDGGYNVLAGTDETEIYDCFKMMTGRQSDFDLNLYGNGEASKIIVEELLN